MKLHIDQLINENTKLKIDLENATKNTDKHNSNCDDPELKKQYLAAVQNLNDARNRMKNLEENLQEMNNIKKAAEEEKLIYQSQLKDCEAQMENVCQALKTLESEISHLSKQVEEKDGLINKLISKQEDQQKEIIYKENSLQILEKNKKELVELLEKTNNELEESKKDVLILQQQLVEASERNVRRNLENELKEAEIIYEQSKREEDIEGKIFSQCLGIVY